MNIFRARVNSIERVAEYHKLPQEAPHFIEATKPAANWPMVSGTITYKIETSQTFMYLIIVVVIFQQNFVIFLIKDPKSEKLFIF